MDRWAKIFVAVMLLFVIAMVAYVPVRARLDFQIADVELSLETSRGRERKQQAEYDEVTAELPVVITELEETQPLADAAKAEADELKAERKRLRAEKKELEAALEAQNAGEASGEE